MIAKLCHCVAWLFSHPSVICSTAHLGQGFSSPALLIFWVIDSSYDILDASKLLSVPTMTTKNVSRCCQRSLRGGVSICSQTPSSDSQFYGEKLTNPSQQKVKACSKTCSWTQTLRWCGEVALVTHFATTTGRCRMHRHKEKPPCFLSLSHLHLFCLGKDKTYSKDSIKEGSSDLILGRSYSKQNILLKRNFREERYKTYLYYVMLNI